MKKTFKFTLDTETDLDVIQIIERVPKAFRSQFLVEVVRIVSSNLVNYVLTQPQSKNLNLSEQVNTNNKKQETPVQNHQVINNQAVDIQEVNNQEVNNKEKTRLNISKLFGGF